MWLSIIIIVTISLLCWLNELIWQITAGHLLCVTKKNASILDTMKVCERSSQYMSSKIDRRIITTVTFLLPWFYKIATTITKNKNKTMTKTINVIANISWRFPFQAQDQCLTKIILCKFYKAIGWILIFLFHMWRHESSGRWSNLL